MFGTVLLAFGAGWGIAAEPMERVDFAHEIHPLLSEHCFQCHGPDAERREAELRLDTRDGLLGPREGGAIVVPGNKRTSRLFARLTSPDDDQRMPPPHADKALTPAQIARFGKWIEQGAPWQRHWAFEPPKRPPLPSVRDPDWCQNAVDRFVLSRLEQNGLGPSAAADKITLLRRVTLDLTGLPPTPAEVDAFLGDAAAGAYERAVDRLLQSPHYGERMALPWLDAARYADTSGYQTDGVRHMWRWRDWVIDAFNRNQPFDQFTLEQLAGDLLPRPTLQQRIATGFNRNHRANSEGGIVDEEFLVEYAADRVETTATVWLGLTLGCARCHDHKYDPLQQRDFYRMLAYFNNLPERGRVIKYGNSAPTVKAPTELQAVELRKRRQRLADAQRKFRRQGPRRAAERQAWERTLDGQPPLRAVVDGDLQIHLPLDGTLESTGAMAVPAEPIGGPARFVNSSQGEAVELTEGRYLALREPSEFDGSTRFTCSLWIRPQRTNDGTLMSWMDQEDTRAKGLSVELRAGRLRVNFGPRWLDDALRVETDPVIQPDTWQHVAIVYDGSQMARGLRIFVDGKATKTSTLLDVFTGTFPVKYPLHVGARGEEHLFQGAVDDVRFYLRRLSSREVAVLSCGESANQIAALPAAERTSPQAAALAHCFLQVHADSPLGMTWAELEQARADLERLDDQIVSTMVMQDRPEPHDTFLLLRGQYDKPGEQVTAGVPGCLPPLPPDAPPNRLTLAQWLVHPEHPLTARVAVNRIWQALLGRGIVPTAEDFGAQGQPPTHPQLLDWLAIEFVDTGWDVKQLVRVIVTSATYRQDSRVTELLLERDPDNRWLSRAARLRLPAEIVRDQALAASQLLVPTIGGPSVKPYQPEGLWTEIASDSYTQDEGDKLYRRGMYTFWKRTVPPPTMVTFDATSRETCTVRRARTNTPLQALALMNDTALIEASRALAERMMREGGDQPGDRLAWGFRLVLARPPSDEEKSILLAGWQRSRARFQRSTAAARELLDVGARPTAKDLEPDELAAFTMTANLILNLDEAVTRE